MTVQALRKTSVSFDSARRDAAHFIDGAFTTGSTGKFWENRTPLDNSVIGRVPEGGKAEIDAAVRAAKAALSGPWGRMTVTERTEILARVADGINARLEEFLAAECLDTGKPSSLARHLDIPRGAANFKMFADTVKNVSTETFVMPTPDGAGAINYGLRRPKGVIAVISPWNLPLLLMTWKVGPALACGNTVVVKPSEETPLTATLLGEVMNAAGVPKGVYNVVHGLRAELGGRVPDPASLGQWRHLHRRDPHGRGDHAPGRARHPPGVVRTRRQESGAGVRRRRSRQGDRGRDALVLLQLRPGLSRHRARLCPAPDLRRVRRAAEGGRGRPEARPSGGPGDQPRPAGQQGAPREGAGLLQKGGRRRRDHRHRRRRSRNAARTRRRRLDRAHHLDRPSRHVADRQ